MKKVTIEVTPNFQREAKRLIKKYKSLIQELYDLNIMLQEDPDMGTHIGQNTYKIRLGVKSKGKGKRGGMRVITYQINIKENLISLFLISIFDKSEQKTITKDLLKYLIGQIKRHED